MLGIRRRSGARPNGTLNQNKTKGEATVSLLTIAQAERLEGSFSEGTLRNEDVGGALVSLLDSIGEAGIGCAPGTELAWCRWNARKDELAGEWERCADLDSEEASEMVSEMFSLVNDALPPGFTCEASEGDGASFGVWRMESEEDTSDRPCAKCGILTAPDPLCPRCDPTFAARYGAGR